MAMTNWGRAKYEGLGKAGKGHVWTKSGALDAQPYGFQTRFEDEPGTNPEEQIAVAHASCFTMALSFALAKAGHEDGTLETKATVKLEKEGDGFRIASSMLELTGAVPGLERAKFEELAQGAKENCPVSKVLRCEIGLTIAGFEG